MNVNAGLTKRINMPNSKPFRAAMKKRRSGLENMLPDGHGKNPSFGWDQCLTPLSGGHKTRLTLSGMCLEAGSGRL